jgi:hypothetical protein
MSATVETREVATGTTGGPRRAPWCGVRTRAGGASRGPRTAVGLARMVAAKTTHGRDAMSGAPKRLAQRCVRTLIVRIGLTTEMQEARCQTQDSRNDPIRGAAARVRAADAPLDMRVSVPAERRPGETAWWAPGSPGLGEALAPEVMKQRLRGNDPMRGKPVGAGALVGARVARAVTGLGLMRGLALGGTALARAGAPSMAAILAARFGSVVDGGWGAVRDRGAAKLGLCATTLCVVGHAGGGRWRGAPSGITAMQSWDCAQRPYTWSGTPYVVGYAGIGRWRGAIRDRGDANMGLCATTLCVVGHAGHGRWVGPVIRRWGWSRRCRSRHPHRWSALRRSTAPLGEPARNAGSA